MSYSVFTNQTTLPYGNLILGPSSYSGTSYTIDDSWSQVSPVTISQTATIDLKGESADIVINGESLKETLQAIKDALKIPGRIQQDAKLEESFAELRQLREEYERQVKEYREKQKVWDTLNNKDL